MLRKIARNCSSLSPWRWSVGVLTSVLAIVHLVSSLEPRVPALRVDPFVEVLRRGIGHRFGPVRGVVGFFENGTLQRFCRLRGEHAVLDQEPLEARDGVGLTPGGNLVARA